MIGRSMKNGAEKTRETVRRAGAGWLAAVSERPALRRALECAARFAVGWLLAGAVIFDTYAPFGAGFVAASGSGIAGFSALCGVIVGAVMQGGAQWAVKYAATALLVFAAAVILKEMKLFPRAWFMPVVSAVMAACTGMVYVAGGGWVARDMFFFAAETLLTAAGAYFYCVALTGADSPEKRKRRAISLCAAACTLLIALSDVRIAGMISLGRMAAAVCVMTAAYKGGGTAGAAAGVAAGAAMDAALGGTPVFAAAFAASGGVAGLFSGFSRLAPAAAYIIVNAACAVWTRGGELALSSLYEAFLASVIFLLLPDELMMRFRGDALRSEGGSADKAREYVRKRALLASEAFSGIYETLGGAAKSGEDREENITAVFEAAAERKCAHCPDRARCYGREFEQTRTVQNDAAVKLVMRGTAETGDFPEYFSSECRDMPGFIRVVNEEYAALLRRRERLERANDSFELLCGRFLDMSEIFASFAELLQTPGNAEREVEERVNLYLRGKALEATCSAFRDRNGRLHLELDGDGAAALKKQPQWLDKLAQAAARPLCEMASESGRRHMTLLEAEPLAVRIGVASMRRDGESVSGDKGAYFKTDSGLLYVILSDGMGSGAGAAQDSGEVIALLERFLRAGITAESAMRLVGAAMQIKNEKTLASASVDLMCINLFSGEADIFKFGAAPTFVRSRSNVLTLRGESLSAGMRGTQENMPDHLKARLGDGCSALIVSDGVAGEEDCEWIRQALRDERTPGREFARELLEEAGRRHGCTDDMTVISIIVEKRQN